LTFSEKGEESRQTVENPLPKWADLLSLGSFPPKRNILGEINVEKYGHRFVSVSRGYLAPYFMRKQ
jgi:hypothetical protein